MHQGTTLRTGLNLSHHLSSGQAGPQVGSAFTTCPAAGLGGASGACVSGCTMDMCTLRLCAFSNRRPHWSQAKSSSVSALCLVMWYFRDARCRHWNPQTSHLWDGGSEPGPGCCQREGHHPHLLQRLGSRVAHLVDQEVLPLLEGLSTLITDVVPHLWGPDRE